MSSSIWTRCAGASERRPLRLAPWRAVEAQHQVSTRKLVDTLDEQALLEDLIEAAKPPDPTRGRLHYLLSTPFRYPPLRHGSRFGGRQDPGIWYGSETHRTAFAEVAYYRFVFLEGTHADLGAVMTQLTVFRVQVRTASGLDLVAPPFDAYRAVIASPDRYADTQALGRAMRQAAIELFRYPSARDAAGGVNVGVMSPAVFGTARPRRFETWHCTATRERVELVERDYFRTSQFTFLREAFLVGGSLPAPAP
jgi:hypothetical protein